MEGSDTDICFPAKQTEKQNIKYLQNGNRVIFSWKDQN